MNKNIKTCLAVLGILAVFCGNAFAAITVTAGAWAVGTTSCSATIPATPAAGDVMVFFVGAKPYNATYSTPSGWTLITGTNGSNGTVANATDLGSVVWTSFYRVWQSGDANPSTTITSGNTALCVIHRYTPTAGSTIDTPVGAKGSDTSSGTGYSATMDANPGVTTNDLLSNFTFIAGNNATFASPTITATGATIGTVTENPATEGTTAGGLDCEASSATATVSSGTASAAAVVGWTLSVAQTGGGALVRIRETTPPPPAMPPNSLMMMGTGI